MNEMGKVLQLFVKQLLIFLLPISLSAQVQIGQDIDGEAANDLSGCALSMPDSNTVAIGAWSNNGGGSDAGHVRVYRKIGNTWVQKGADIDGEASGDNSGNLHSISMPDSNTIAIGAYGNSGSAINAGHVRVFTWISGFWIQKGLDIDGEAFGDWSGRSVSMPDANTIAIGAPLNDASGTDAGHARVFIWDGNTWIQKGRDIDGEASRDNFGHDISMPDSNTLAVSAMFNDGMGINRIDVGHVRVFRWQAGVWQQKGNDIDGEAANDWSGHSISMPDSNTLAIGAIYNDGNGSQSGHVRIYTWNGSSWQQKGADINGEAADDNSGFAVSMSDANTVAIGSPQNDGNGSDAGHVRLFDWNGSAWVQRGLDIDGESASDLSGYALTLQGKNTLAIGAIRNTGNGFDAGHTRVYSFSPLVSVSNWPSNNSNGIKVYYASEKIWLLANDNESDWNFMEIINLKGQVAQRERLSKELTLQSFNPINLEQGIYLVRLTDGKDGFLTKKIVIP